MLLKSFCLCTSERFAAAAATASTNALPVATFDSITAFDAEVDSAAAAGPAAATPTPLLLSADSIAASNATWATAPAAAIVSVCGSSNAGCDCGGGVGGSDGGGGGGGWYRRGGGGGGMTREQAEQETRDILKRGVMQVLVV